MCFSPELYQQHLWAGKAVHVLGRGNKLYIHLHYPRLKLTFPFIINVDNKPGLAVPIILTKRN